MPAKRNFIVWAVVVVAGAGLAVLFGWRFLGGDVADARWYSPQMAVAGAVLFEENCVVCHGAAGVGTADWQRRNADGAFPPPPLNGSAHTWHHSLAVLRATIDRGGAPVGGVMPGFAGKLKPAERDSIIAYFQDLWSAEIYQIWATQVEKIAQ